MHYRKNFLSKVIFKVDFKSPLSSISDENYSSFSGKVKERYSFTVSKPITRVSFRIEPTGSGLDRQVIGKIWEHRDKEGGNKILVLSPEFLVLEYQNRIYTHFAEFKEDMAFFYEKFQSTFDLDTFPRIGLRYINEISLLEGNPLDWEGYIKHDLISSTLAGLDADMKLTRSMHQFMAKCSEDASVLFQYGIFNPEFPNPVSRREYILDIDCFIPGAAEKGEVIDRLSELNVVAAKMFEDSIGEKLRALMEVIT